METATTFRWAAAGFVLVALVALLYSARSPGPRQHLAPQSPAVASGARDPLLNEQRRCQALGAAGAQDAECLRAWAQTRDRFIHGARSADRSS